MEVVETVPAEAGLRVWVEGTDLDGEPVSKGGLLPPG